MEIGEKVEKCIKKKKNTKNVENYDFFPKLLK